LLYLCNRDGPWPNPMPQPSQTIFDPRTLWPYAMRFFWPKGQKIVNFWIFRGNFPNLNLNHRWPTQPKQEKIDPNGSIKFDPDPSLILQDQSLFDCPCQESNFSPLNLSLNWIRIWLLNPISFHYYLSSIYYTNILVSLTSKNGRALRAYSEMEKRIMMLIC